MTSQGHICAECPDTTRVDRGCPYPLHDERMQRRAVEPSCPVLDVPEWYWSAAELGASIERGGTSPAHIDAAAWELGRHALASLDAGRRAAQESKNRRREIIARARERARGGG